MSAYEKRRTVLPINRQVRSLCWDANTLVDWVDGGTRYHLNGETECSHCIFSYRFDRAKLSPDRRFVVLYEVLGTKGLIIRCEDQKPVREINRSFYVANRFEYPIAVFNLPNGKPGLAHCPDAFNKLQIEELESGRPLATQNGKESGFFHSRLEVSPASNYLISSGWIWQPYDDVEVFNISNIMQSPPVLEANRAPGPEELLETHSATFQSDNVLVITGDNEESTNRSTFLATCSLSEQKTIMVRELSTIPGTIMAIGLEHLIGFHGHPKLFELSSGKVVHEWPELKSGHQNSAILRDEPLPYIAMDPVHRRFAVAAEDKITVVELV